MVKTFSLLRPGAHQPGQMFSARIPDFVPSGSELPARARTEVMSTTSVEDLVAQRVDQLLTDFPPRETDPTTFWGAQFDLGLAWVYFPEGRGGLGASPKLQPGIDER